MRALLAAGFLAGTWLWVQAQDVGKLDLSLVLRTWRVKGVLYCPRPCVWVENAYPTGLLEISRQTMKSRIVPLPFKMRTTSSHTNSEDGGGATLQFAEARVFYFVPPLDFELIAKPRSGFYLTYVSELDAVAWRSPFVDQLLLRSPRIGFITQDSEVLAAYEQALRGARVAAAPAMRVVLGRYPYEPRTGHFIQMIHPQARPAITIGSRNYEKMERQALSLDGSYVFVHYGIFESCRRCLPTRLVGPRTP